MTNFSPREIVSELDRYIIGQADAKRAVAIALRNRWRRQQLTDDLREEVQPKNILMIGPTGVGKPRYHRRLAKLANAPFVKVEATKFTEVGYVGRDVEQIIRDLVETGISLVRDNRRAEVQATAHIQAEERVLTRWSVKILLKQRASHFAKNCAVANWTIRKSKFRCQIPVRAACQVLMFPACPAHRSAWST